MSISNEKIPFDPVLDKRIYVVHTKSIFDRNTRLVYAYSEKQSAENFVELINRDGIGPKYEVAEVIFVR